MGIGDRRRGGTDEFETIGLDRLFEDVGHVFQKAGKRISAAIHSELRRLAGTGDLGLALERLSLTESHAGDVTVVPVHDWIRGGAETFIARFTVLHESGRPADYILKACVCWSPGFSPTEIIGKWVGRRLVLSRAGIRTPRLLGHGDGILLEEFIPFTIAEALRDSGNEVTRTSLITDVARLAGTVSGLGFHPLCLFHDLRSHGNDAVLVDCGEDLGEPSSIRIELWESFVSYMSKLECRFDTFVAKLARSAYDSGAQAACATLTENP